MSARGGATQAARVGSGGLALALVSAASFGVSGPFAKSLLGVGWTPGSVVFIRVAGTAMVLLIALTVLRRVRWRALRAEYSRVLVYGVLAVAGVQICYFSAVEYLPVSVALLLEYLAPLLVVLWVWLVRNVRPTRRTVLGGTLALFGLFLVVEVWSDGAFSLAGFAWGLGAAVCQAAYFVVVDQDEPETDPLLLAASGSAVAAVVVGGTGISGLLPFALPHAAVVEVAGSTVSTLVPLGVLVLVSGVSAYVCGVYAIPLLGATRSSLVALSEVLFATIVAWVVVGEAVDLWQALGGALLITGLVVAKTGSPSVTDPPPTANGDIPASGLDTDTDRSTGTH